jgi:iron complex transport system substrate-binding protein
MGFSLSAHDSARGSAPISGRGRGIAFLILCALSVGCDSAPAVRAGETEGARPARAAADGSVSAIDDVGREVRLAHPAQRLISLLPAGTETLFALGAGDRVVGRTRYDVDPRVAGLPSVGGGLDPSLEAILALRPDLVLAFETASTSKVRTRLEALGIPVYAIQTQDTADIFRNVRVLGHLVGREAAADSVQRAIRAQLDSVRASVPSGPRPRVLYVASVDPPMMAGARSYIAELLGAAGAAPVSPAVAGEAFWPQISLEALIRQQPDVLMLPVGEDPTASVDRLRAEPGWRDLRAVQEGRVAVVSADLMNRPGPNIGESARRMRQALDRVTRP